MLNPIALSIPAFILLIGAEVAWSWRLGRLRGDRPTYRLVDAVTDLACGISSQATGLLLSAVVFAGAYTLTWTHLRLWTLPDSLPVWLLTFVLVDLVYYLWHRASHRVNLLWAAHVVHHQSEDYNLAVALRQSILTALTTLPFYLPFALLGVSPLVLLTVVALNTVYQFWIHTRLVGRLGPIEWVMNTPSHHRVHHGINPGYIDKNHAGVFIVWDRLFGTFVDEGEEPVYGTVQAHRSADAIEANVAPLRELWAKARAARGLDRLRMLVAPPEWRPAELGGPVVVPEPSPALRFDPRPPAWLNAYALMWLVTATIALTALLFGQHSLPWTVQAVGAGLVLWALRGFGGLIDERPGARAEEGIRLGATPVLAAWVHPGVGVGLLVLAVVSGVMLWRGSRAG